MPIDKNGVPTVEVRDEGVGMDPEHLETIFNAHNFRPERIGAP